MAKYLDREAAVKAFNNFDAGRADSPPFTLLTPEEFAEYLYELPTADVAPVVHGRWKLLHKGDWTSVFVCSVCGRRETITESESYNSQLKMPRKYPYCHCGAKMDECNEPEN